MELPVVLKMRQKSQDMSVPVTLPQPTNVRSYGFLKGNKTFNVYKVVAFGITFFALTLDTLHANIP